MIGPKASEAKIYDNASSQDSFRAHRQLTNGIEIAVQIISGHLKWCGG